MPDRPLEAPEGFALDPDGKTLVAAGPGLWQALQSLEGRWLAPDPALLYVQQASTISSLTRHVQVEVEVELPAERDRLLVGASPAHKLQALDQGLGDPLVRHAHGFPQEILRHVGGDMPHRPHSSIMPAVQKPVKNIQPFLQVMHSVEPNCSEEELELAFRRIAIP